MASIAGERSAQAPRVQAYVASDWNPSVSPQGRLSLAKPTEGNPVLLPGRAGISRRVHRELAAVEPQPRGEEGLGAGLALRGRCPARRAVVAALGEGAKGRDAGSGEEIRGRAACAREGWR